MKYFSIKNQILNIYVYLDALVITKFLIKINLNFHQILVKEFFWDLVNNRIVIL